MKIKSFIIVGILVVSIKGQSQILGEVWNATKDAAKEAVKTNTTASASVDILSGVISGTNTSGGLTNDEVIKGLKEALTVGTTNSSGTASKVDGFLKNPKLFIPWPSEAKDMRAKIIK